MADEPKQPQPESASSKQSVADLGKLVKAKYPQYAESGISDFELGRVVRAKYPEAYAQFPDPELQVARNQAVINRRKAEVPEDRGFWNTIIADLKAFPSSTMEFLTGHPLDQIYTQTGEMVEKMKAAPGLMEKFGYGLAGLMPVVGPAAARAGEEYGAGQTGQARAHALELLVPPLRERIGEAVPPGTGTVLGRAAERTGTAIGGAVRGAGRALPKAIEESALKYTGLPQVARGALGGAREALYGKPKPVMAAPDVTFREAPSVPKAPKPSFKKQPAAPRPKPKAAPKITAQGWQKALQKAQAGEETGEEPSAPARPDEPYLTGLREGQISTRQELGRTTDVNTYAKNGKMAKAFIKAGIDEADVADPERVPDAKLDEIAQALDYDKFRTPDPNKPPTGKLHGHRTHAEGRAEIVARMRRIKAAGGKDMSYSEAIIASKKGQVAPGQ